MTSQPPSGALTAVLVVGESLVDVMADGAELPGGSSANVAVALGRLGNDVTLLTGLGDDRRGHVLAGWLSASGVRLDAVAPAGGRTSAASVTLDADGVPSYEFELDWDLDRDADGAFGHVHAGSIAAYLRPGDAATLRILEARRGGATTSYDPNIRTALIDDEAHVRARVDAFIAAADVVKVSDEDLAWLAPGADTLELVGAWLELGPAVVVVTHGASGASIVSRRGFARIPAVTPVAVVDTVAAGDTVMAALIDGFVRLGLTGPGGSDRLRVTPLATLSTVLERALRAAAVTVARPGADPPWAAEIDDHLEDYVDMLR